MVLLFLLLGSDAQVCDKYDVHDIDWKVVCICAHYGLFKHQTRTWQKKSGQKIGSKVLNLFLKQGTCRNTYYIYKNIYIWDKLRAPNNLQIRGQFIWVNNIIMGFGLGVLLSSLLWLWLLKSKNSNPLNYILEYKFQFQSSGLTMRIPEEKNSLLALRK